MGFSLTGLILISLLFWPFEKYEFHTSSSSETIMGCLREVTAEDIFSLDKNKLFWGKTKEKSFTISRFLGKRNSYKPILKGEVEEDGTGSIIRVKMRMSLFAMIISQKIKRGSE